MPNHITNIVSVAGKQSLKTLLAGFLHDEAEVLDFNKVIPMPEAVGFRDENLPISPQSNTAIARAFRVARKLYLDHWGSYLAHFD